jgi:hypothetical protein
MQYRATVLVLVIACGSHDDPSANAKKAPAAGSAVPAPGPPVEKLAGNVAVEQSQALYPTEAAARAHAKDPIVRTVPIALKIIADHGDVIEVTTEPAQDCIRDYDRDHGYTLAVFVPRAALIPRAAATLHATYPDGTAVAIDRGALLNRQPLAWRDEVLAATALAPGQTTLAVPPADVAAELPVATGEKMICERDRAPELHSKWLARKRKAHRAEPARRAPPRDSAESFADALLSGDEDLDRDAPSCGAVASRAGTNFTFEVGGRPVPWPRNAGGEEVFITAAGPREDVYLQCARVRMSVEAKAIGEDARGGADLRGGGARAWEMHPGKVVWPDGTPAGTFTGSKAYFASEVEAHGELLCVRLEGVAERVCHHAADAKNL